MVIFKFSCLDRKYPFWSNLVQKFTIVCLRWNLIPRLIEICETQWGCSFLLLWSRNIFSRKIGQEFSVVIRFCSSYLILLRPALNMVNYLKFLKKLQLCRASCLILKQYMNKLFISNQSFFFSCKAHFKTFGLNCCLC